MKKTLTIFLACLLVFLVALSGCKTEELKITKDLYVLEIGETATIQYSYSGKKSVLLSVSDEAIITLDGATITGRALGTTTVNITAGSLERKVSVEVTAPIATALTIPATQSSYHVNQTVVFKPVFTPSWIVPDCTWVSSDADVVTVSDDGTAVMKSQGQATLVATSRVTPSVSASITITVEQPLPSSVTVSGPLSGIVGEALNYVWEILPVDAFQGVRWSVSSSPASLMSEDSQGNLTLTFMEAGEATLIATTIADGTVAASRTITITKADAQVSLDGKSVVYDGSAQSLVASASAPNLTTYEQTVTFSYFIDGSPLVSWPTKAGTYTIRAVGEAPGFTGEDTATLVITKAVVSYPTVGDALVYDGSTQTAPIALNPLYELRGTTALHAGIYTASVTLLDPEDYEFDQTSSLSWTILPAAATVTADDLTSVYQDPLLPLTATVVGAVNGESLSYQLSCLVKDGDGAGSYRVTVTLGTNPDYAVTATNGLYTIAKQPVNLTLPDASFTYDGATHGLSLAGTMPTGVTVVWKANVQSKVGSYAVSALFTDHTGNYDIPSSLTATLTITPAPITGITFPDQTVSYDGKSHALTIEGTLPAGVTVRYVYASGRDAESTAGSYAVIAHFTDTTGQYETLAQMQGVLTISRARATLAIGNAQSIYGDAFAVIPVTTSGLIASDVLLYTLSSPSADAGTYTITATLGDNKNYDVTVKNGSYVVTRAFATIEAQAGSSKYGSPLSTLMATVGGTVGTDTLDYTIATEATSASLPGSYPITITLGTNANYQVLITNNIYTVSKIVIPGALGLVDQTVTYDGVSHSLLVTGEIPSGIIVNYQGNECKDAGSYTVTATFLDTTGCYILPTPMTATLVIEKKSAKITAGSVSTTYGVDVAMPTATVTGTIAADTLAYTLTLPTDLSVGIHPITVTLGTNPNYTVTTVSGAYVVNKAIYDVSNLSLTDESHVYDGNAHVLEIAGTLPQGLSVSYTDNVLTHPGMLTVIASFEGDAVNYEAVESLTATLTVNKAVYDVSSLTLTSESYTYDGAMHTLEIAGALPEGLSVAYTENTLTSPGTLTVIASFEGDAVNYEAVESLTATLTVNKAVYDVSGLTLTSESYTYDGNAHVLKIAGALPEGLSVSYTENSLTSPGTLTVIASFEGDAVNYEVVESLTATLTVTKAVYDVSGLTLTSESHTYDGNAHVLKIAGTLPEGLSVAYTENTLTSPGTLTVIASFEGDAVNYEAVESLTATLTVTKATYAMSGITFTNKSYTYDGSVRMLLIAGTLPAGVTVSYSDNTLTEPGTLTVTASFEGDAVNYEAIPARKATLTVKKIIVAKPVASTSLVYDGTLRDCPYVSTANYTISGDAQTAAGSYKATASLTDAAHYAWTGGSSTNLTLSWSIAKASVTITADDATSVYGEELLTLSAVVTGACGSDVINYTLTMTDTTVGAHVITVTPGTNANYTVTTVNGTYTVTKKTVFVMVDSVSKNAGDADPTFTATVTGLVGSETLTLSFIRQAGETAGTYVIFASVLDDPHYTIYIASGTLTIL